jgi:hypothetical protein
MTANIAKFGEVLDMAMRSIATGSEDSLTNSNVKIVGTALSILEDIVSETPAAASQLCKSLVGTTRTLLAMNRDSKARCSLLPLALRNLIAVGLHASADDPAISDLYDPEFDLEIFEFVLDKDHTDAIALYLWGLLVTVSDHDTMKETMCTHETIEKLKGRLGDAEPLEAGIRDGDNASFCSGFCALLLGLIILYRQSSRGFADSEILLIRAHLQSVRVGLSSPWGKGFASHVERVLNGLRVFA